jgi:hypothetical protein
MSVSHEGFKSYYVRVDFDGAQGFTFHPHCLDIQTDILATITWFTDNPHLEFTGFHWCNENEHLSEHPLIRGSYMVGAAQTMVAGDDIYWKYQVKAKLTVAGRSRHVESTSCTAMTDGLPRIHPN